jgi:hypothetical protein
VLGTGAEGVRIGEHGVDLQLLPGRAGDPDLVWAKQLEVVPISSSVNSDVFGTTRRHRPRGSSMRTARLATHTRPFFTNSDEPTADADITHRRHAIIETTFADLIDGPLARMPSGRFGANSAWVLCAGIAHNLLRAAAALAGGSHAVARGATLRRKIVNIPARLTRPQRRPVLRLPSHWPWADAWLRLWHNIFRKHPPPLAIPA